MLKSYNHVENDGFAPYVGSALVVDSKLPEEEKIGKDAIEDVVSKQIEELVEEMRVADFVSTSVSRYDRILDFLLGNSDTVVFN